MENVKYENLEKRKCKHVKKIGRIGSMEMWNKIGKCKEN